MDTDFCGVIWAISLHREWEWLWPNPAFMLRPAYGTIPWVDLHLRFMESSRSNGCGLQYGQSTINEE
jgi:hypothetical protein